MAPNIAQGQPSTGVGPNAGLKQFTRALLAGDDAKPAKRPNNCKASDRKR